MTSKEPWLAAICSLQSAALLAQSVPQAPTFPRPATIRVSDNAVAARVSDCDDWLSRLGNLPTNYKWAEFKQPPSPPAKDEFETTSQYEVRLAAFANGAEHVWINIAFDVDRDALTYDADRGVMSVQYRHSFAGLDSSFKEGKSYIGVNAFGVAATVTPKNLRTTGAKFEPSTNVLPSNLQLFMSPDEARKLKESGKIHVLGIVRGTDGEGGFSRATLSSPTDFSYGHREIRIAPICVAALVDGIPIQEWQSFTAPEALAAPPAFTPPVARKGSIERALEEYPRRALQEGRQGRVSFRLEIGVEGRVTKCVVTSSSGHADLDDAACINVSRYARFEPAKRYGAPVVGQFESSFSYSLR